jgi:hypothetical protein
VIQEDRLKHLENALAHVLPGYRASRSESPVSSSSRDYWFEVPSPLRPELQRLVILLRSDGDIQVEYHVAGKPGSPFEELFDVPAGQEMPAIEEVIQFVRDLTTERLVLAYARGVFQGGRRFLTPNSVGEHERRNLQWVTSWQGTYDWQC